MAGMLVLGVDENGLGPRLGPLVATSLTLQTPRYARAALCARGLSLGLTDSKKTGGFGRMGFIESVALALLKRVGSGVPDCADALVDGLHARGRVELLARCPDGATAAQCWAPELRLPAFGGDASFGEELIERLIGRSELRVIDVQSRLACAGMLNSRLAQGTNKLAVDLELFEDLIASARARHGGPLLAVCGMIGGIRDYASRMTSLGPGEPQRLPGRRAQRRYAIDGLGEIRFEVDADARHLPVALASIVGKYVREICMLRIGRFYRRADPSLELSSGYHDPVTSRFIEQTEPLRRRLRIVDACFRRQA